MLRLTIVSRKWEYTFKVNTLNMPFTLNSWICLSLLFEIIRRVGYLIVVESSIWSVWSRKLKIERSLYSMTFNAFYKNEWPQMWVLDSVLKSDFDVKKSKLFWSELDLKNSKLFQDDQALGMILLFLFSKVHHIWIPLKVIPSWCTLVLIY